MVMCFVADCQHYNQRERCRFYRFPKDKRVRKQWIKFIRRERDPGPGAFVCSCHFVDENKENGPTLFLRNEGKRFEEYHLSPERKKVKGSISLSQLLPQDTTNTPDVSTASSVIQEAVLSTSMGTPGLSAVPSTSVDSPELSVTVVAAENYFLTEENNSLKTKLSHLSVSFSYEHIKDNDKLVLMYTGIPSAKLFEILYSCVQNIDINYYYDWNVERLPKIDQLLMTLMKLRLNCSHEDLAVRFSCSQTMVSNVVTTFVHVLSEVLYKQLMGKIPPRSKNMQCLPNCFSTFTNCRIIIDCTEIFTAVPRKSMQEQKNTYSSYKHRNTWKVLVGVAPNGVITFISNLYPGATSDKQIVAHCQILEQMEPGDLILADKGFLIRDLLPPGVHLNIPPFLTTPQFTQEQVYRTECIAKARVHVERAIRRLKCYSILNFIPHSLLPHASAVLKAIGGLTNFQYPLIKEVEQYYCSE